MWSYILKRLLLMIPTLFGIVTITFVVIQFVPGGPVEQMVSQLQGRNAGGEGPSAGGIGYRGRQGVDAERVAEIRTLYGFDKPASQRFAQTVGQFAAFLRGAQGKEPSDPRKVAELISSLVGREDAPLRLLVGPDAVEYASKAAEALAESDKKWRDVSVSTAG